MALHSHRSSPERPSERFLKLEQIETELPNYDGAVMFAADTVSHDEHPVIAILDPDEIALELGLWVAGLLCFPRACTDAFHDRGDGSSLDLSREFRLSLMGLQRCSGLTLSLRKVIDEDGVSPGESACALSSRDIEQFAELLRGLILLNCSLAQLPSPKPAEWSSWSATLEHQLGNSSMAARLSAIVRASGRASLSDELGALFTQTSISFSDRSDIDEIASRIGVILRSLSIVERMLQSREPLKPAMVIFAALYDQTKELLAFVNNRLSRFPDEQAALFTSLDISSYGASLELKKVFQQELRGIVQLVPGPSVHARVETAYSLLLDTFQQMLVELARVVNPNAAAFDFFPRFETKLGESIELRKQLWNVFRSVQASEGDPSRENVSRLREELTTFAGATLGYLYFKDQETVERFSEEVHAAREKKDLVPVLHRFGAYLETLLGQVSMRAVLAGHPFEQLN